MTAKSSVIGSVLRKAISFALCGLLVTLLVDGAAAGHAQASTRRWSNEESIGFWRYVGQQDSGWYTPGRQRIFFSPSGESFFVMTDYGRLSCDCNFNRITVFSMADIRRALAGGAAANVVPQASAEFRSTSHFFLAVAQAHWIDDRSIALLGSRSAGARQIFVLDTKTGRLAAKTTMPLAGDGLFPRIDRFSVARDGLVYVSLGARQTAVHPRYPLQLVSKVDIAELGLFSTTVEVPTLHVVTRSGRDLAIVLKRRPILSSSAFVGEDSMPPTAQHAVVGLMRSSVSPAKWSAYDNIENYKSDAQFFALSFGTGKLHAVMDAPLGTATKMGETAIERVTMRPLLPQVIYTDASHAVLVNAALPLAQDHPEFRSTAFVLGYDLATGALKPLIPVSGPLGDVVSVERGASAQCVGVTLLGAGGQTRMTFGIVNGSWAPDVACAARRDSAIQIAIEEGPDQPPRLVASRGTHHLILIDRQPDLQDVRFAPARPYSWTDTRGGVSTGALTLPIDGVPHPVPLVILSYHYNPDYFFPDGVFPTFPAQALATAGFAVLQMKIPATPGDPQANLVTTPAEGSAMVERVDAAVAQLAREGVIDRAKVGMIGFSRGGFMASYVAMFPQQTRLAAVIADDSFSAGYLSYLVDLNLVDDATALSGPSFSGELEQLHGGKPFWLNKSGWMDNTMSLNLEKLRTPMLLSTHDGGQGPSRFALSLLEESAAIVSINAPIQLARLPFSNHQPILPRERVAVMDLSVDWMRFWLKNEEDSAPEKSGMYLRWREMRKGLSAH